MIVANSGPPLLREWYQARVPVAYICVCMTGEINSDRGHLQRKNRRAQYNQPFPEELSK